MSNILITGGCGFVGSSLADGLRKTTHEHNITIVDDLSTGDFENCKSSIYTRSRNGEGFAANFIKCDVNNYADISQVMLAEKFDYVFHYAACVGVQRTQRSPISVLNDIEGFKNILSLSKNTGVRHVYFSSSSEVYGEPVQFPQNEHTTPLNSKLPYAIVKNLGEAFLKSYQKEHGLNYTIFRFFNTYGERQSSDFVVSRFIRAALANEDITIYGDGSQSRTFCYIDDNVEACVKAFEERKFVNDVVNIGGDEEYSVLELAKLIIHLTASKSKIVHLPALKEGDMSRRLPDNTKMKELLGRELLPLVQGLRKIIGNIKK